MSTPYHVLFKSLTNYKKLKPLGVFVSLGLNPIQITSFNQGPNHVYFLGIVSHKVPIFVSISKTTNFTTLGMSNF